MASAVIAVLSGRTSPAPAAPARPASAHPVASTDPGRAHDYDGPVTVSYAPVHDGAPDPGEVVWTWVPYEEDASQGKDRPVVVMGFPTAGRAGELAVLMLTSKDRHSDPRYVVLGSGGWDPKGRVSSVRLDRVLAVSAHSVRREGAALERDRFDLVAAALRARHGWR
jgi:PemK-like, MazF-like toxin of type II toxin-antitoxin system